MKYGWGYNSLATVIPVDPAGPDCYRGGAKPCESAPLAMLGCGARLSNMWLTYPQDGDNLGKLRLIPDR